MNGASTILKERGRGANTNVNSIRGFFVYEHLNWNISYASNVYEVWLKKKF